MTFLNSDWEVGELAKGNLHIVNRDERDEALRKLAIEVVDYRNLLALLKKGLEIEAS